MPVEDENDDDDGAKFADDAAAPFKFPRRLLPSPDAGTLVKLVLWPRLSHAEARKEERTLGVEIAPLLASICEACCCSFARSDHD